MAMSSEAWRYIGKVSSPISSSPASAPPSSITAAGSSRSLIISRTRASSHTCHHAATSGSVSSASSASASSSRTGRSVTRSPRRTGSVSMPDKLAASRSCSDGVDFDEPCRVDEL